MVKNRVFAIHEVARTSSTQDVVRRAAESGAEDGFCCLAHEQTAGRGRLGRHWVAPPGTALLASVLLRVAGEAVPGVPFAAGLAMRDAIEELGVDARLKWPNDLLAGEAKLCGVLAEVCSGAGRGDRTAVIVGAGVNLTVPGFPDGVAGASLHRLVPHPPRPRALLGTWLRHLGRRVAVLEAAGLAGLLVDWRRHAAGLGATVRVERAGSVLEGVAEAVRDDGALLVRTPAGVTAVLAGDVQLLGRADGGTAMGER